MVLLKNDFLEIELNPKGAEIIKIIGQKDGGKEILNYGQAVLLFYFQLLEHYKIMNVVLKIKCIQ